MTTTSLASRPCRAGGQTWCVRLVSGARRGVATQAGSCRQRWIPGARSSRLSAAFSSHPPFVLFVRASGRRLQEDAHAAVLDLEDGNSKAALFAVLDGHGGAEVARFAAKHLVSGWWQREAADGRKRSLGCSARRTQADSLPALCTSTPALLNRSAICSYFLLYCLGCLQAQELVASEGYKLNDVGRALVQTFLHMDELLVKVGSRTGGWLGAFLEGCNRSLAGLCWF